MWDAAASAKIPCRLDNFTRIYQEPVPLTMSLCDNVQANFSAIATHDASRNGACTEKQVKLHYLGFDAGNVQRENDVDYPFWWAL